MYLGHMKRGTNAKVSKSVKIWKGGIMNNHSVTIKIDTDALQMFKELS